MYTHHYYCDWLLDLLREHIEKEYNIPINLYQQSRDLCDLQIVFGEQNIDYEFHNHHFQGKSKIDLHIISAVKQTAMPGGFSDIQIYSVVEAIGYAIATLRSRKELNENTNVDQIRLQNLRVRYDSNIEAFVGDVTIAFIVICVAQATSYMWEGPFELPARE